MFYLKPGQIWAVSIETSPSLDWQEPKVLFDIPKVASPQNFGGYDVRPDGQRFVFAIPLEEPRPREIRVVLNWFEELKEKLPIPEMVEE